MEGWRFQRNNIRDWFEILFAAGYTIKDPAVLLEGSAAAEQKAKEQKAKLLHMRMVGEETGIKFTTGKEHVVGQSIKGIGWDSSFIQNVDIPK